MSAEPPHGACFDLAPAVYDKYFIGGRGFTAMVGRAICAGCGIRRECLEDAIVEPPGHGMRGGVINAELWRLHDRWMDDHEDAADLAAGAMRLRPNTSRIRSGQFVDVPLAFPELGGAA